MRAFYSIVAILVLCLTFCRVSVAQGMEPVRVIVIPFKDSGYNYGEMARLAEDKIRSLFLAQNHFEPIPADEVRQAANRFNLAQPYAESSLKQLALELKVHQVLSGEILTIMRERESNPNSTSAGAVRVRLRVELKDIESGDLLDAISTWGSVDLYHSIPMEDDEAVKIALIRAARWAADSIYGFETVERALSLGTIAPNILRVNVGSRHGANVGREVRVLRKGMPVGKLRISRVFTHYSEATVIENAQEICSTDTARMFLPEGYGEGSNCIGIFVQRGWRATLSYRIKNVISRLSPPRPGPTMPWPQKLPLLSYPDF
jgi:hypothetical protein